MYIAACITVFFIAYLVNTSCITVFYHRGLAHGGVTLSPIGKKLVVNFGSWLTGLDPKGWVCMHRLHHVHSDEDQDPHSPHNVGILGVAIGQLRSYERILIGLARRNKTYTKVVEDLDFDISWLNRRRVWWLPYLLHLTIALSLGVLGGWWILGGAYFFGIMSHPVEGWMVNAFGHAVGGRNFDTPDKSRNNHLVAWFVHGEGFQNNHHRYPNSARFSYKRFEFDSGYLLCLLYEKLGLLTIEREKLMPRHTEIERRKRIATKRATEAA